MRRIRPKRIKLRLALLATVTAGTVRTSGMLVDISKRGLSIRLPSQLESGTTVEIQLRNTVLQGQVRYCRPHLKNYLIGIQLQHSLARLQQMRSWNRLIAKEAIRHADEVASVTGPQPTAPEGMERAAANASGGSGLAPDSPQQSH